MTRASKYYLFPRLWVYLNDHLVLCRIWWPWHSIEEHVKRSCGTLATTSDRFLLIETVATHMQAVGITWRLSRQVRVDLT